MMQISVRMGKVVGSEDVADGVNTIKITELMSTTRASDSPLHPVILVNGKLCLQIMQLEASARLKQMDAEEERELGRFRALLFATLVHEVMHCVMPFFVLALAGNLDVANLRQPLLGLPDAVQLNSSSPNPHGMLQVAGQRLPEAWQFAPEAGVLLEQEIFGSAVLIGLFKPALNSLPLTTDVDQKKITLFTLVAGVHASLLCPAGFAVQGIHGYGPSFESGNIKGLMSFIDDPVDPALLRLPKVHVEIAHADFKNQLKKYFESTDGKQQVAEGERELQRVQSTNSGASTAVFPSVIAAASARLQIPLRPRASPPISRALSLFDQHSSAPALSPIVAHRSGRHTFHFQFKARTATSFNFMRRYQPLVSHTLQTRGCQPSLLLRACAPQPSNRI